MEFLVFTLTSTLASMGDLAGNEYRSSLRWPAKSAILGLLGAAKGLARDDQAGFCDLDLLRVAVGTHGLGDGMVDFHTVQTVPRGSGTSFRSRPHALECAKQRGTLETVITRREYRADATYSVAIWGGALGELCEALDRPRMALSFGRRCCPLAAPVAAQIVDTDSPITALSYARMPAWLPQLPQTPREVFTDHFDGSDEVECRVITRHDVPLDRRKWRFALREVLVVNTHQRAV